MAEALTNQAYEYLYRKIVSCEYLPGQELNEKQLLEETSFGRTPLREALLMLQAEFLSIFFREKECGSLLLQKKALMICTRPES
ncbi:MAG: GntR family transcriptional regulator [Lachnospiraceae bacterium]